jgi:hypothetical protein
MVRNSRDLELVWRREVDLSPDLRLWRVAISADGGLVAASASNNAGVSGRFYVGIFDGKDGKEMARFNHESMEGLAISPDMKLLAAGQRVSIRNRIAGTQPTVFLYDLATNRQVATLIHDQFYGGGGEFLYAGVSTMFTPDGDHLVTTGLNTRVWKIGT